jgi:uncharacterized protein (UPF0548 family)
MFRLTRPTPSVIEGFRTSQGGLEFSYAEAGMTRGGPPRGFVTDHTRGRLGSGEDAWQRARAAIRTWRMFDLGWVELHEPSAPLETGTTVAVLVRIAGLWSLNAARIVYVIDEPQRFGFAYGTLPGHVESGEERFLVERASDGGVDYDILAYSRPNHWLARAGKPWVRVLQKRFGAGSLEAMTRAVMLG